MRDSTGLCEPSVARMGGLARLMGNPSKKKGTLYESALLVLLRLVFGSEVERAPLKGVNDEGDFVNVPLPIEAKNTKVLLLPDWARRLNKVSGHPPKWALFWSGGDRRRKESPGELMVVPADFGRLLLELWNIDRELNGEDGDQEAA